MNIASPAMAALLVLLPLFWLLVLRQRARRSRRLALLLSSSMQERLVPTVSSRRRLVKFLLLSAALLLVAVAALRPRIGVRLETVEQSGIDLAIAIDTSRSMLAADLAPSRLDVAKRELRRLLEQLGGDRVALIAFAGGAVLQCPLTDDYTAVELFLDVVDVELVSTPGTNLAAAIDLARQKVFAGREGDRVLVLLTDGESTTEASALEAARDAAADGIRIYTIGIGSTGGSPLPVPDGKTGEYRRDAGGEIVLSRLDASTLEQIASIGGGRYYHVEAGRSPLGAVLDEIGALEGKRTEQRVRTVYDEQFPAFLLAAILFLAVESVLEPRPRAQGPWRGRFE